MQRQILILLILATLTSVAYSQTSSELAQGTIGTSSAAYYELSLAAQKRFQAKDFKTAAEIYERLTTAYPWNGDHWYWLGRSRYETNQFAAASQAFVKADQIGVSVNARDNAPYAALAFVRAGEHTSALDWLEKAILVYRYDDETELLRDKAFNVLRRLPRFQKLAAPPITNSVSRVQGWTNDIDYLVRQIKRYNSGAPGKSSSSRFVQAVAQLKKRIKTLSDVQLAVELVRILNILEQPHNEMSLESASAPARFSFPGTLPVYMSIRAEGVYITSVTDEFDSLLRTRVVAVNYRPIDRVLAAIRLLMYGREEPSAGDRVLIGSYLSLPHVLQAAGVTSRLDRINITVADNETTDKTRTVELPVLPNLKFHGLSRTMKPPLAWSRRSELFWFEPLPESRAVYVNFSGVGNKKDETLADFGLRLRRFLNEHQDIKNLIVDARFNTGGNTYLYNELLRTIIAFDAEENHRVFMLIGRNTGSAAMNFCVDVDRLTNAVFAGEPTFSGTEIQDAAGFVMTYSRLTFYLATANWHLAGPRDTRRWIAPDIPVPQTGEDTRNFRDPVMETVISLIRKEAKQ